MELRHLRHFLAVAETLKYSRAAELLNMSASPLSRSIQQLEIELGGALFARGTRKVELTPLGQALIPHANRALEDVDVLTRDIKRRVLGHVELYIGMRSIPPQLTRALIDDVIKIAEPSADVRLEPADSFVQMDRILSGKLSFGIVNRRSEDRRLEYLPVLTEAAGLALPDEERFAQLAEIKPKDVTGLKLLLQTGADPTSPVLAPYLEEFSDVVAVNSEIVGGISAIIAEGGACCMTVANPSAPWHRYLAGAGVIVRPFGKSMNLSTSYLCWRGDRDNDDDLAPMIALARERFAQPLAL